MARTKSTAYKLIGGKAPREQLCLVANPYPIASALRVDMTRTKSTAYQLTGGKAPREQLSQTEGGDKPPAADAVKKAFRYTPSTMRLEELRKIATEVLLANKPKLYIPRSSFRRLVREITLAINPEIRFTVSAMDGLQEAAEDYVVSVMNDPTLLRYAPHMSHDLVKDIQLARRLRGNGRDYWFFLVLMTSVE